MDMKAALAELIGTFTLVFVGTATAVFAGSGILGSGESRFHIHLPLPFDSSSTFSGDMYVRKGTELLAKCQCQTFVLITKLTSLIDVH